VVGDTRMSGTDQPPVPALYVPHAQKTWHWMSWLTLMVRPAPGIESSSLTNGLKAAVRALDPELPIERIAQVTEFYAENLARRRFATILLVGFAVVALVLGVTGMYGVLSYAVAQRRRDIGIRAALGASRGVVLRDVVIHAMRLALLGIALGLAASVALGKVLRGLLYETTPTDPLTLAAVAVLLVLVALAAASLPAWRAARISPLSVMRDP
jgi:predicted lysophospholipase L1 biosynthesis ABC-type transport system permease subunit